MIAMKAGAPPTAARIASLSAGVSGLKTPERTADAEDALREARAAIVVLDDAIAARAAERRAADWQGPDAAIAWLTKEREKARTGALKAAKALDARCKAEAPRLVAQVKALEPHAVVALREAVDTIEAVAVELVRAHDFLAQNGASTQLTSRARALRTLGHRVAALLPVEHAGMATAGVRSPLATAAPSALLSRGAIDHGR